jgi:hypothetical protein
MPRARPHEPLAHVPLEALLDGELAAIALGVDLRAATAWLARGQANANRTLDRRLGALSALRTRLARRSAHAPIVADPLAALTVLGDLPHRDVEELHVLALDPHKRLLGVTCVARGGVNQVTVTARDVLRPIVLLGASAAIVAHNHPSGDPSPSEADRVLTARLGAASALVGVPLVDHLVVAARGHHSFAAEGRMPRMHADLAPARSPSDQNASSRHRRGNVGQRIGIG